MPIKWRTFTLTFILITLIQVVAPSSWEWSFIKFLSLVVGVHEACGLRFLTAGILGTVLLFGVLQRIVAYGGPIPLTPWVILGMNLWLAFLVVVLVHTPIDALLHASKPSAT